MQRSLKLKTYEIPEDLPTARELCQELASDLEKTHAYYQQQIAFIKQQYKIALAAMRATVVSADTLRHLFDESEMTVEAKVEIDDEDQPERSKKRKKKKAAIPDHLPRDIVEHDVEEAAKTCAEDGTALKPLGYDTKLELKYTRPKFEVIEHRYPKYGCDTCKGAPVRQAPALTLIPKSYASPELLAHIAVAKFCDHRSHSLCIC